MQVFLSARSWSAEDTAHAKPFGDSSNIYRVPGFQSMDREGAVHFAGDRSVPCVDTVRKQTVKRCLKILQCIVERAVCTLSEDVAFKKSCTEAQESSFCVDAGFPNTDLP